MARYFWIVARDSGRNTFYLTDLGSWSPERQSARLFATRDEASYARQRMWNERDAGTPNYGRWFTRVSNPLKIRTAHPAPTLDDHGELYVELEVIGDPEPSTN